MKFLIISAFLIACVLSVPRGWQWTPIGLNTRTALGAYHHVQREYEGRLRMGRFLLAYRRWTPATDDVRIIFNARSVPFEQMDEINVSKQGSPRWDAALCGVTSGAILFAYVPFKGRQAYMG